MLRCLITTTSNPPPPRQEQKNFLFLITHIEFLQLTLCNGGYPVGDPTHLPVTTLSANTEFSQTIELMPCYAHMIISPQKGNEQRLTVRCVKCVLYLGYYMQTST